MLASLFFVAVVLLVLLYYRRRVNTLKTELAHVQYHADPRVSPDRHHFDNPAYSYTGRAAVNGTAVGVVSDDGSLLPLNNMHKIHNNLGSKNNLNIERQRAGCSTEDDDDLRTKGPGAYGLEFQHPISAKNWGADLGNPNLNMYQAVDEKAMEHVYDEIKQAKEKEAEMEYDHLDYSRPASSWKPQYHHLLDKGSSASGSVVGSSISPAPSTASTAILNIPPAEASSSSSNCSNSSSSASSSESGDAATKMI